MSTNLPTLREGLGVGRGLGLGLLLLGGVSLVGCRSDATLEGAAAAQIPVLVRPVTRIDRPAHIALSGDVEAWRTANVGFLVPGLVSRVGPQEGDAVKEGDLLAELDSTEYRINLDMASAQRERAEDELSRAQMVFDQKGIPANDFNKAQTALKLASAQEALARKKLSDTRIEAPMSGVVARRGIEPGEQAGPGLPVFTVVQVDPAQIRVGVPETEIGRIAVGQQAVVSVPSLDGSTYQGKVRLVGIAADPASRTYTVKIRVPNKDRRLRPGMIAEVQIEKSNMVRTLSVPGEAVVQDADGVNYVFVYFPDEQRVHRKRVEVGTVYGQEVEISDGLTGDEMVVVGGQNRVREGSSVVARQEEGTTATPDATEGQ